MASNPIVPTPLLRIALLGDAAASGATGLLMAAGAGALAGPLGLPVSLLLGAGLVLLPYAALVAWLGRGAAVPRGWVRAVIAVNLLWVVDSVLVLAVFGLSPTPLGTAFVLAQAAAVAGFAALQYVALRRAAPVPA